MDYRIILSPDLDLVAADFSREWNSVKPCNGLAVARLRRPSDGQFDPSFNAYIGTLSSIPVGLSDESLHDAIKVFFKKRGTHVSVKFIPSEDSEESDIIVIKK